MSVLAAPRTGGNRFTGEGSARTGPRGLPRAVASCPGRDVPLSAPGTTAPVAAPPGVSFEEVAAPGPQQQMPGVRTAPGRSAVGLPGPVAQERYRRPAP